MARVSVLVLRIPATIFMPIVALFSVMGSYALGLNIFNVYLMFFFGIVVYFLEEMRSAVAPIVIGVILGQMADVGLRRGLLVSHGDLTPFFTRPVAFVFVLLIIYALIGQSAWAKRLARALFARLRRPRADVAGP